MNSPLLPRAGAFTALAVAGLFSPTAAGADSPGDTNVLLLMSDEHTPRVLGCYGDPIVQTPTSSRCRRIGRTSAAWGQAAPPPLHRSRLTHRLP